MLHNDFAISLTPKCQSGVNYHNTGVLIGLAVLIIVLTAITSLSTQSSQAMAKTYPSIHVAQTYFAINLQ